MNQKLPGKFSENVEKVFKFRQTLTPETDRGCALIAAAFLDAELVRLSKKSFLQESKGVLNEFFEFNGALGTFSSRIHAAYLLGQIDKTAHQELHLIRKIRNVFGHDFEPITFASTELIALCQQLVWSPHPQSEQPRMIFTGSVCALLAHIHIAEHLTIPPKPCGLKRPTKEDKARHLKLAAEIREELAPKKQR